MPISSSTSGVTEGAVIGFALWRQYLFENGNGNISLPLATYNWTKKDTRGADMKLIAPCHCIQRLLHPPTNPTNSSISAFFSH